MATSQQQAAAAYDEPSVIAEARRKQHIIEAAHQRQHQGLTLQRENILSQRTSHPIRRVALEAALKQIDAELAALDTKS